MSSSFTLALDVHGPNNSLTEEKQAIKQKDNRNDAKKVQSYPTVNGRRNASLMQYGLYR